MSQRKEVTFLFEPARTDGELAPVDWLPSQLFAFLQQLEKAIGGMSQVEGALFTNGAFISLAGVQEGSIKLPMALTAEAIEGARQIGLSLEQDQGASLPYKSNQAIGEVVRLCKKEGVKMSVGSDELELADWNIDESVKLKPPKALINCRTFVTGPVVNVHVGNMTAALEVNGLQVKLEGMGQTHMQTLLSGMNDDIKQRFRVSGLGTWDTRHDKIVSMAVESVSMVRRPDRNTLSRLRRLMGGVELEQLQDVDSNKDQPA